MCKKNLILFIPCIIFIVAFISYFLYPYHSEQKIISKSATEVPNLNKDGKGLIATNDQVVDIPQDFNQKENMHKFFGVWSLDRIVLESNNYDGEKKRDGRIFSEKEYLGYEVEYTSEFFRLGEQKFFSPKYKIYDFTFYDYNNNGDFEYPDLYYLVEEGGIKIDHIEEYENIGDIPLVYFTVSFEENNFIPVGSQCVLLNEDTMLVGVWGNVILAHRVD